MTASSRRLNRTEQTEPGLQFFRSFFHYRQDDKSFAGAIILLVTNIFRTFFIFLLAISSFITFAAASDSLPDTPETKLCIAHLYYNGNHVTKAHIIQMISRT